MKREIASLCLYICRPGFVYNFSGKLKVSLWTFQRKKSVSFSDKVEETMFKSKDSVSNMHKTLLNRRKKHRQRENRKNQRRNSSTEHSSGEENNSKVTNSPFSVTSYLHNIRIIVVVWMFFGDQMWWVLYNHGLETSIIMVWLTWFWPPNLERNALLLGPKVLSAGQGSNHNLVLTFSLQGKTPTVVNSFVTLPNEFFMLIFCL